ncbi:MAG TPA: hypothetical protein VKR57_01650 [Terriglobales bacterium]|jgi:hypothetical protein|nr:hypothetical protein [Terriglobales bacterium]
MKRSLITGSLITVLVALVCISLSGIGVAQDAARPMFKTLPPHNYYPNVKPTDPAVQLPQWTFNWTSSYDHRNFSTIIVGTDPSKTNTTTTVTVGIIPIKMVYGASNGNMTFDPSTPFFGNYSTTEMVADSPIFKSEFDYKQGGVDLGKTQYIDAYQRGDFWTSVQTNTNYHIILKTVIGPEQTFTVPAGLGNVIANPWSGIPTGTADINWFDGQLQTVLSKYKQIQPNVLPLFITENVYLTEFGGCCVGGYHSANAGAPSGQTYSYSTSIQQASVPVFSQDVGALAHEVGEWLMDPFTTNPSPCPSNSILEIGDPLETETGVHDFGDWPYTIGGFTFHPQDLVFITWFGAPASTSVNNYVTFQGTSLAVCQTAS